LLRYFSSPSNPFCFQAFDKKQKTEKNLKTKQNKLKQFSSRACAGVDPAEIQSR